MTEDEDLLECPVCLAIWTHEEVDTQECSSCGCPDPNGCLEEDYDFDEFDEE